jgi:hypothetical protein
MAGGATGHAPPVRPIRGTGQTGADLGIGQRGFCGRGGACFASFAHGTGGWHGESGGSVC